MPLGLNAEAPVGSAGNLQHKVGLLNEKDLLIAISFGRCLRDTMHAVRRAKSRGVPTFGITDGSATPIAMHCDAHLIAPIGSPSFTGSYVAPMALINAITLACTHLQPARALAILRHTEGDYRSGERWYQEPLRAAATERSRRNGKRR
jgi:DNA-binding MurR/RpiR family transcriptional regulator